MATIGYTTGVFDMFHVGHLNILRRARRQCDRLLVGVTTDELCESTKGKRPIIPFAERIEIVASIKGVDEALPQTTMDKVEAWRTHRFNRMFVGSDWQGTPKWVQLEQDFRALGVEIVYFPYTQHTSSTILRRALGELVGEPVTAAARHPPRRT